MSHYIEFIEISGVYLLSNHVPSPPPDPVKYPESYKYYIFRFPVPTWIRALNLALNLARDWLDKSPHANNPEKKQFRQRQQSRLSVWRRELRQFYQALSEEQTEQNND